MGRIQWLAGILGPPQATEKPDCQVAGTHQESLHVGSIQLLVGSCGCSKAPPQPARKGRFSHAEEAAQHVTEQLGLLLDTGQASSQSYRQVTGTNEK